MIDFKKITIILGILLLLSLGGILYMYTKKGPAKTQDQIAKEETAMVIAKVGQLMVLPADETPSVASVTDPDKLRDQSFFANAKVGDKVLIYQNSRKAILYSPSLNKIIEVSPINIGSQANPVATTTEVKSTPTTTKKK